MRNIVISELINSIIARPPNLSSLQKGVPSKRGKYFRSRFSCNEDTKWASCNQISSHWEYKSKSITLERFLPTWQVRKYQAFHMGCDPNKHKKTSMWQGEVFYFRQKIGYIFIVDNLLFTISPAILYLVTTKSSAIVFSATSSLSAMFPSHCNVTWHNSGKSMNVNSRELQNSIKHRRSREYYFSN